MAWQQGFFVPKNPQKYRGDVRRIVYRSSWELKVFNRLDIDPQILWWSSEEHVVPCNDRTTGKMRRYFPDVVFCKKTGSGTQTVMAEIKPKSQSPRHTSVTRKRGKSEKKVIAEAMVLGKNAAKWESAERYCAMKGWKFVVLTEKELGIF